MPSALTHHTHRGNCALRVAEPVMFRGGDLCLLAKRASSALTCEGYRFISISSVPGKVDHRCLHQQLLPALLALPRIHCTVALPSVKASNWSLLPPRLSLHLAKLQAVGVQLSSSISRRQSIRFSADNPTGLQTLLQSASSLQTSHWEAAGPFSFLRSRTYSDLQCRCLSWADDFFFPRTGTSPSDLICKVGDAVQVLTVRATAVGMQGKFGEVYKTASSWSQMRRVRLASPFKRHRLWSQLSACCPHLPPSWGYDHSRFRTLRRASITVFLKIFEWSSPFAVNFSARSALMWL